MHEDELKTTGIGEDEDAILPSGWKEGDDIFADSDSWSGVSEQADESAEDTAVGEHLTDPDSTSEEAPTTGEADDEQEGQSADNEAENPAPGQVEEPAKRSRILKLKVNHQSQEVDVESLSDDELIERLQKAAAFDALRDDQLKEKYRKVYQDQIYNGMTEAAARMVAAHECGGRDFPLEDTAEASAVEPESNVSQPASPKRDFEAEVRQLKALYPDFSAMPDEVAHAVANGAPLLSAYVAYREQQTRKAADSLRRENEVLKHNAASAAKAPVKGVTGGGAANTRPKSDFLRGFDSEDY